MLCKHGPLLIQLVGNYCFYLGLKRIGSLPCLVLATEEVVP